MRIDIVHIECDSVCLVWIGEEAPMPDMVIRACDVEWPDGRKAEAEQPLSCPVCHRGYMLLADGKGGISARSEF